MIKEETKFIDSNVFEGMTSIRAILASIDANVNTRKINRILFDKARLSKIAKNISYLRAVSQKYGFDIIESTAEEISEYTLSNYEKGKTYPDVPVIKRIEKLYGVSYNQLIFLPFDYG